MGITKQHGSNNLLTWSITSIIYIYIYYIYSISWYKWINCHPHPMKFHKQNKLRLNKTNSPGFQGTYGSKRNTKTMVDGYTMVYHYTTIPGISQKISAGSSYVQLHHCPSHGTLWRSLKASWALPRQETMGRPWRHIIPWNQGNLYETMEI